jgi:hypothetical protein
VESVAYGIDGLFSLHQNQPGVTDALVILMGQLNSSFLDDWRTTGICCLEIKLFWFSESLEVEIIKLSFIQCCGSGFARIRNFLQDPEPDPELEVGDPDTEQDLNLPKTNKKKIVGIVKE